MANENEIIAARRAYAEELRATSPVLRNESVVKAFATVPRERFLGPGPWTILPGPRSDKKYVTPDDDPRRVYHDVLVPLDASQDINNGQPSLWAYMFDQLDVRSGERLLQIGAGTGYYTAILAEMVGTSGTVTAVEYDRDLAAKAAENTASWPQIDLVHGDGATHDPGEVDLVVAFAGLTHPIPLWLDRLAIGGRLLVGLTANNWWGFMLLATRTQTGFEAQALGGAGFVPFVGRDTEAGERLGKAIKRLKGKPIPIKSLHRGDPPEGSKRNVWYWGPGFWLSRR